MKPLYAASSIVAHDPFQRGPNPLGPYFRGDWLGITLRQWLAARPPDWQNNQVPLHFGVRFSAKARGPSRVSLDCFQAAKAG